MTPDFKDHFSDRAAGYATYRPHYPPKLADYLAGVAPAREMAWDVGCGSGQLSTLLGDRFKRVIATDASEAQIARAVAHPTVEYGVATAESAPMVDRSVDLIVAAQAAHWFDLPRFYEEVRRVAGPSAVVALVTYTFTHVDGPAGAVIDHFYFDVLGKWWLPERRQVEKGYQHLDFPFDEINPPVMEMSVEWSVDQLIGYVGTWSAVRAMEKGRGDSETKKFADAVRKAWGPAKSRRVSWPLVMRVGRVSS